MSRPLQTKLADAGARYGPAAALAVLVAGNALFTPNFASPTTPATS